MKRAAHTKKEPFAVPAYDRQGRETGTVTLDTSVFDGIVNDAVMHQVVTAYRANQRKGLASVKDRGEVSGGGKKPWKQKGTGRARQGSIRSPLWRHGGVTFGPKPRDFTVSLSPRMRKAALKSSLNAKVRDHSLAVIDSLELPSAKTKEAFGIVSNLKLAGKDVRRPVSALFVTDKSDESVRRAFRNINFVDVNLAESVHCYDVLSHARVIITKEGLDAIIKRLSAASSTRAKAGVSA
jgi:large subunit ribosomal protein L4